MDFEKIYDTYFDDVYLYVRRLSGNEHVAEEIASETFFKAMSSIKNFRGECDIRVWLCQIAKNSYFSYLKKNGKTIGFDDVKLQDLADPNALLPRKIPNEKEDIRQAQKAVHTLPELYREVFMWRVFADLSFKQIGELFHKTDNWACVTYHRARKMIKSRLEEPDSEK
ncbi:MAG: sigma-70 family RNA polymerase sigma factor [Eubacteriales bacterium]|jgi:RNA polymerase sigma factor (sigma-70 family)|nr:sigma-70 family RNA polymerase sigma factor [Eubacteriales bacterium]MCI6028729.1 sigma-70 family RNA polymerase sigma factor [Clostridiales bacterium]